MWKQRFKIKMRRTIIYTVEFRIEVGMCSIWQVTNNHIFGYVVRTDRDTQLVFFE